VFFERLALEKEFSMEPASEIVVAAASALGSIPIGHLLAFVMIAAFAFAAWALYVVVTLTKRRDK